MSGITRTPGALPGTTVRGTQGTGTTTGVTQPTRPTGAPASAPVRRDAFDATRSAEANVPSAAVGTTGRALHTSLMRPDPTKAQVDKVMELWAGGGKVSETQLVNNHPVSSDNSIDFLVDGKQAFHTLFDEVSKAEKSINVSYYIFSDDKKGNEFADMLIAKAKSGVEVNLMVDGVGSTQMLFSPTRKIIDKLEKNGVAVIRNHVFDPARDQEMLNHPDHRKLVLIDGKVGFTGGMNMADHYYEGYHDIMIKVEGSAVRSMQSEWLTSWMHLDGKLDRTAKNPEDIRQLYFPDLKGPEPGSVKAKVLQGIPGENPEIFKSYLQMIGDAQKSIKIENPYCTNPEIQNALVAAAKRGVDVTVILPGESDHGFSHLAARCKYPEMMAAGVKIFEYPGFNHDKVMVVDDERVNIGSSNLDDVALRHIYELNLDVKDKGLAADITKRLFDVDLPKCTQMKPEDISTLDRVTGSFFNLFSSII